MLPEQQQRILGYFIEEAKDHLNTIEQGLLNLQATIRNPEMANEVFRAAHSVKGGAAMLGIESMQRTAHRMEDYFKLLKEAPVQVDRSLESMFLRVFDALQELLEQLQGPFGLTDDKEQSIMASVEPVFQQLQEHLDQLVAEAGTTHDSLAAATPVATSLPAPQPIEESALKLVFSSDVSASLREMLARFKQADTDESRSALEGCCQLLERLGEQFNLPTWMNLVKHARWAVCDRNHEYRTLAPVLIKEIKKAQDLVLAGREPEISISETLQTLAAQGANADTSDDLDALFAGNELDISSDIDLNDLSALDQDLTVESIDAPSSTSDEGISLDDLLNDAATSPSGPEVGAAELTSLADLFETGGDALDSDWQEEDVPINEEVAPAKSLDIDIAPDFEDLLNDDSSDLGSSPNDFESGSELADLFGDTGTPEGLDSPDSRLDELTNQTDITDDTDNVLSEGLDSIDDLFDDNASPEEPSNPSNNDDLTSADDFDLFSSAADDSSSVDDLFNDLDQPETETGLAETGLDESPLAETTKSLDELDELTASATANHSDDLDELTDIDLGFETDAVAQTVNEPTINDLLSDSPADTDTDISIADATAGFFDTGTTTPDTANPDTLDSTEVAAQQSDFDDFFNIDDATPTPPETESESLDNDLWATASGGLDSEPAAVTTSVAPTVDDLSADIWAEDSQDNDVGTAMSETDMALSVTDSDEPNDDLNLDDVWASVEDVSAGLDDGVSSGTGESTVEPDQNLASDTAQTSDSLDDDILSAPPSNDLEFDLLDLEDGGIVTGFVTDEQNLEQGADNLGLGTDANMDLMAELTDTAPDDANASDLNTADAELDTGLETELGALDLEDSLNELATAATEEATEPDAVDALSELSNETSEAINQPDLAFLTSDSTDMGDDNIIAPGSSDNFGDLDALLDSPDESTSPVSPAPPAPDLDDEFGDLEALLQDADQALSPTAASGSTSYRPTTNRLSGRRMVTDQTMRVSVSHLDNLSNLVGELVVNRNTLEQDQERLRQFLDNLLFQVQQLNDVGQRMRDLYERSLLESSLISSRQSYQVANAGAPSETTDLKGHATGESFDALEMDRFTGFHTLSQEMIELIVRVRESASDIAYTVESSDQVTRQFRQVTNQLQEGLNKARMVPFAQTAARLPRAVRDISLKCGKEARLVVEGRDILIDKMILEQLYDPMTHLVNNAITHGVETPEKRRAAGKAPEGVITVRAFYQGNQTVISVGDDGAGIDPNIVKQKALQKGLIAQSDVQTMTVLDVYDLLFHPGFSTRDQADDFAGRGFGMDVVRTSLADIRGNITIDSEPGRGTDFTIRLPLTLSISKALSCISNQARIAFPMDGVEDMFDVSRERIQQNDQGQDCILWRDTLLPFQNLSDLLSFNRTLGRGRVYGGNQDENMISIVVLRSTNSFIALEVDQVMGEQEIVIKQLEGPVPKPTGIAGATVLGDGRVMPIADVLELIDLALGRVRREPNAAVWAHAEEAPPEELGKVKSEPTVLIVDDSITVRELLSMSFNKVGYRVEQARDGQEAWEKLRSGLPCDLVFCDIEMPRMDGLELLSRLQKDDGLQQIPIAMLTSRGADRHRQMAVDLGASGYFTKPYLEEALLDAANKMLHGEKLV